MMLMLFVQISHYLTYLFIFTIGFLSTARLNVGFIYGAEVFKEDHAPIIGSASLAYDALTMVFAALYFNYISNEWSYLQMAFLFLTLIPLLISL